MEKVEPIIRMQIDGIELINRLATKYSLPIPHEIVRMGYDSTADVLYAHFHANAEATNSEINESNENIILGLNRSQQIVRITILNASQFFE